MNMSTRLTSRCLGVSAASNVRDGDMLETAALVPSRLRAGKIMVIFMLLPFQTGVDIWIPATEPPDGTISFTNVPGKFPMFPESINIANWQSEDHRVLVHFNAYFQGINSWPKRRAAHPSPCK